jgi:hypothetical protein
VPLSRTEMTQDTEKHKKNDMGPVGAVVVADRDAMGWLVYESLISWENDVYTSSPLQTRCFCQDFGTKNMRTWSVCIRSQVLYEQLRLGNERKGRNRIFCGIHASVVSELEHSESHESQDAHACKAYN